MLTWFVFSLLVSVSVIFILHNLYKFLVRTLTFPIEKDIANSTFNDYKNIYGKIATYNYNPSQMNIKTDELPPSHPPADRHALATQSPRYIPPHSKQENMPRSAPPPRNGILKASDTSAYTHNNIKTDPHMQPFIQNMNHNYDPHSMKLELQQFLRMNHPKESMAEHTQRENAGYPKPESEEMVEYPVYAPTHTESHSVFA